MKKRVLIFFVFIGMSSFAKDQMRRTIRDFGGKRRFPYTQSEAYLQGEGHKKSVAVWKNSHKSYQNSIDRALRNEKRFQEYAVFYHVQPLEYRILQDLTNALYELEYKKQLEDYLFFSFYKYESSLSGFTSQGNFFTASIALFANSNQSVANSLTTLFNSTEIPRLGRPLNQLLSFFINDVAQRVHLIAIMHFLLETMRPTRSDLVQIFVPWNLLGKIVKGWDKKSNKPVELASLLALCRSQPKKAATFFDTIEGHFFLTDDYFGNPDSGLKFIRYSMLSAKKEALYKKIVSRIAQFIHEASQQTSKMQGFQ